MKKQSRTESRIKQALPEIDIDEDLKSLSEDLDKLEIWASFKNSPIGKEFIEQVEMMCARRLNLVIKDHRKLEGGGLHDFLAEINVLTTIIEKANRADREMPELQEEIDKRVETLASLVRKSSGAVNSGL